jgi:hypothetical protein
VQKEGKSYSHIEENKLSIFLIKSIVNPNYPGMVRRVPFAKGLLANQGTSFCLKK